jgi:uncharacterized cupin superfamily protein
MTKTSVIGLNRNGPDGAGHSEPFKAGDCFVVPKGTSFTGHMPEITRKFYVIFDAKTAET